MIWKNRLFLVLSFLDFISLGLSDGLLGVAWPSPAGEMGQSLSRLALLQLSATGGSGWQKRPVVSGCLQTVGTPSD